LKHTISKLTIKNFRSCINAEFKFSAYTPLVGYNNAGKSNILSALQWLLKKSTLAEKDFNDQKLPVEVIAEVTGLTADLLNKMPSHQKTALEKFIINETLIIRRVQDSPSTKTTDIKLTVWDGTTSEWSKNPNGLDVAISSILPDPIRIGAMENAAEDASKAKTNTTIGKLLAEFLNPVKTAHKEELDKHLSEVQKRISADGDQRFSELSFIDDSVNRKIDDLFPGMSIKLHFETPSFDDLIKAGTIKVYEGKSVARDFSSYGHGAQRTIQITLIQYLSEIKRTQPSNSNTTTLLLIDEPELYLHPFAIEQVREALVSLSNNDYQVVISTHSAQMITYEQARNTLLIRKCNQIGTYARERLIDAIQKLVPNSVAQMEYLFSLSNSVKILFAENVILTEGVTELRLLPEIYKIITSRTMGQDKCALISVGGVDNILKSMEILKAMDIPTKAIVDLDFCTKKQSYSLVENEDIKKIMQVFLKLEVEGKITLHPENRLPTKSNGVVSPARAYEILAHEKEAIEPIKSIHEKMKDHNIWIWKDGAIEVYTGTTRKDEKSLARYKNKIMSNGLVHTTQKYQGILDLIEWLKSK
jgi:predicted ATP-dependent endonuclease of OLD family